MATRVELTIPEALAAYWEAWAAYDRTRIRKEVTGAEYEAARARVLAAWAEYNSALMKKEKKAE